jgi:hypothetical protein
MAFPPTTGPRRDSQARRAGSPRTDGRREFLTAAVGVVAGTAATGAQASTVKVRTYASYGAPAEYLGIVGDFYVDEQRHLVYGPRTKHGWGTAVSLADAIAAKRLAGASGVLASTGSNAATGPQGAASKREALGASRPQASDGQREASSPPARQVPQDPVGYAVLTGPIPPSPTVGSDSDFYIDTATTQLYGPKTGGVWGSPASMTKDYNISAVDGGSL